MASNATAIDVFCGIIVTSRHVKAGPVYFTQKASSISVHGCGSGHTGGAGTHGSGMEGPHPHPTQLLLFVVIINCIFF
jgi:hypothetical protein